MFDPEYMRMASQSASVTTRIPRQERGRLRVAALLQGAEDVIAARGYEAATMTEIAARAGASIGSLYQFFPTKEAIADALRARLADALGDALGMLEEEARAADAETLGRRLFGTFLSFLHDHPALMAIAEARGGASSGVPDTRARLRGHVADILAAYAPKAPSAKRKVTAVVILQLMRGAATLTQESVPEAVQAHTAIEALLIHSLRGLS